MSKYRRHFRKHHRSQQSHNPRRTKSRPQSSWLSMRSRARFLPAIIIVIFASFIWSQPHLARLNRPGSGVLAYATNVSAAGLLSATNNQRQANGVASLSPNSLLNKAAQAKANDMIKRDYWSHQTPDGQQPWVFITNAGYQYLSAGENLAYGFMTSNATVTGWMNSPPHKANLLSGTFTEVGFGIANSANYVGDGQQTLVVAMYGRPQTSSAPKPPAPTPKKTVSKPATKPADTTVKPKDEPKAAEPEAEEKQEDENTEEPIAVATIDSQPPTAAATKVSRIQVMTGGSAIWSASMVILGICAIGLLWALHHGVKLRKWLKVGENFITKHAYIDVTVLALVFLGFVLLTSSGTIK